MKHGTLKNHSPLYQRPDGGKGGFRQVLAVHAQMPKESALVAHTLLERDPLLPALSRGVVILAAIATADITAISRWGFVHPEGDGRLAPTLLLAPLVWRTAAALLVLVDRGQELILKVLAVVLGLNLLVELLTLASGHVPPGACPCPPDGLCWAR